LYCIFSRNFRKDSNKFSGGNFRTHDPITGFTYRNLHGFARFPCDISVLSTALVVTYLLFAYPAASKDGVVVDVVEYKQIGRTVQLADDSWRFERTEHIREMSLRVAVCRLSAVISRHDVRPPDRLGRQADATQLLDLDNIDA